ncbi:MAG: hypothetical protein ACOCV1_03270 [Bacillota bacterium]
MKKIIGLVIFMFLAIAMISCDREPQLEAVENIRYEDYLTWDEVENAQEYIIIVNDDEEYIHEEEYFALIEEGTYEIVIIARASGYENSPESEPFTITIDYHQDANITVEAQGEQISWNEVEDAKHYFIIVNDNIIKVNTEQFSLNSFPSGNYEINVFAVFPDGSNTELSNTINITKN